MNGHERTPENINKIGACTICKRERDKRDKPKRLFCKRGHERIPENIGKRGRCKLCSRIRATTEAIKQKKRDYEKRRRLNNPDAIRRSKAKRKEADQILHRNWRIIKQYGMSLDRYQSLVEKQDNRCCICKTLFDGSHKGLKPNIDHDHDCCSGDVCCGNCIRGLLCGNCNTGLGLFKDNKEILVSALQYLSKGEYQTMNEDGKANSYQVGGSHYKNMKIQPWDFLESCLPSEQFKGFLRGCGLKYLARAGSKEDELLDARKARHFVDKWIEVIERERGEQK